MYSEDQLLPISALQHLLYCERQCALIHLERVWTENHFTAEGHVMHARVHESGHESRREVRTTTGMKLRSLRLGLTGQADVVEFFRTEYGREPTGLTEAALLPGVPGFWRPFPVEYKRGRPKAHEADTVQLCAQALCLEEMLGVTIPAGAIFYGENRQRLDVTFTPQLRETVKTAAVRLHELLNGNVTPPPVFEKTKCERCSLLEICQPEISGHRSVQRYLEKMLREQA